MSTPPADPPQQPADPEEGGLYITTTVTEHDGLTLSGRVSLDGAEHSARAVADALLRSTLATAMMVGGVVLGELERGMVNYLNTSTRSEPRT